MSYGVYQREGKENPFMVTVGVHVSIAKSIDLAVDRAKEIATTPPNLLLDP